VAGGILCGPSDADDRCQRLRVFRASHAPLRRASLERSDRVFALVVGHELRPRPVYPPCTSLGRIHCFWRFPRLVKSTTYAAPIGLRSPTYPVSVILPISLLISANQILLVRKLHPRRFPVTFSGTPFSRARRDGKDACALAARWASALSVCWRPPSGFAVPPFAHSTTSAIGRFLVVAARRATVKNSLRSRLNPEAAAGAMVQFMCQPLCPGLPWEFLRGAAGEDVLWQHFRRHAPSQTFG
jgi:hypothetical protein